MKLYRMLPSQISLSYVLLILLTLSLTACAPSLQAPGTNLSGTNLSEMEAFFKQAKENEATLIAFLHKMPKGADLHSHPSGAVYGETILDNALEQGLYFDRKALSFVPKPSRPDPARYYSPDDIRLNFMVMGEVLDAINMRNLDKQSESGHDHFFITWARYGAAFRSEHENTLDAVRHAATQNVSYLELMIAPITSGNVVDIPASREKFANMQEAIRNLPAPYNNVQVGISLAVNRNATPPAKNGNYTDKNVYAEWLRPTIRSYLEFARDNADLGICGITTLSPEDAWISRTMFDVQMQVFDEEWNRLGGDPAARPKLNLHGGELTLELSPYETMLSRISDTIRLGHASRVGHGVSIAWENDVYGLLRHMRDNGIAVEICLTSNQGILNVSGGKQHPFRLYYDAGVPVALSTDDEGISRSNITMEYVTAATWFDLSYQDLKTLAFHSLEFSFLPGESLFVNGHTGDYSRIKPQSPQLENSQKAKLQRKLITDFQTFEQNMMKNKEMMGR